MCKVKLNICLLSSNREMILHWILAPFGIPRIQDCQVLVTPGAVSHIETPKQFTQTVE
uniref:Uncharacterized protein n=1 Tax=Arion vulgaris TaxID=1028688 RepID=A0A0B6YLI3_9EUPU